jgi:hypothetical protein
MYAIRLKNPAMVYSPGIKCRITISKAINLNAKMQGELRKIIPGDGDFSITGNVKT